MKTLNSYGKISKQVTFSDLVFQCLYIFQQRKKQSFPYWAWKGNMLWRFTRKKWAALNMRVVKCWNRFPREIVDICLWKYSKTYCTLLKAIWFNCSAQKMLLGPKWPLEVTSKLHDSAILWTIPVTFSYDRIKMIWSYPSIPWIVLVLDLLYYTSSKLTAQS